MFGYVFSVLLAAPGVRPEPVQPASACPQLFGSSTAREANERLREGQLDSVRQAEHTIDLTHTGDWTEPVRIRYRGLELVDIRRLAEDGRVAVVRVDDSVGRVDCRPGLYRLGVDDSIGARGSVLAVLDGVVLLAREGQLRYLVPRVSEPPEFRMIWRATWTLPRLPDSRGAAARPAPARPGHRGVKPSVRTRR